MKWRAALLSRQLPILVRFAASLVAGRISQNGDPATKFQLLASMARYGLGTIRKGARNEGEDHARLADKEGSVILSAGSIPIGNAPLPLAKHPPPPTSNR